MAGGQGGGSGSARNFSTTELLLFGGYLLGVIVFSFGLLIGISIDSRVDLYSRLVAYTIATSGLTVALACRCAEQKSLIWKILYLLATIIVFGLTCHQVFRLS